MWASSETRRAYHLAYKRTDAYRRWQNEYRAKLQARGLCISCTAISEKFQLCIKCRLRVSARRAAAAHRACMIETPPPGSTLTT